MVPQEFKDYFLQCSEIQQQKIVDLLLTLSTKDSTLQDTTSQHPIFCPHCKNKAIIANGRLHGVQRFRCKTCRKNFSETTGKFWYNLKKKDKLPRYLYCLLAGYSIRRSAKETGISIQTSFNWRHKLFTSFSGISPDGFTGIVESDALFFLHSEKGNRSLSRPSRKRGNKATKAGIHTEHVAVIATCDRSGNKDFKVATRGRISRKYLAKTLQEKLAKTEVLCSDSHRSYTAFAKEFHIEHKQFNASKGQRVVDKVYHIQNINNLSMRLRKFMHKFNGVASKYLQNYLNWFLVLEKVKHSTQKLTTISTLALTSNTVWFDYKNQLFNILIRI